MECFLKSEKLTFFYSSRKYLILCFFVVFFFFPFFCFAFFVFVLFLSHRRCSEHASYIEYASVLNMPGLRICYLAYSQPRYIQSPAIFRTLAYSKLKAYSEPCQTATMRRNIIIKCKMRRNAK